MPHRFAPSAPRRPSQRASGTKRACSADGVLNPPPNARGLIRPPFPPPRLPPSPSPLSCERHEPCTYKAIPLPPHRPAAPSLPISHPAQAGRGSAQAPCC
ncbi:hypothetical protein CALCODRAFT_153595 [Calocera cornea HHB12733]|uniref:Uncharacterized protein n=1 Tax=Calocera cornea HHB12733 TaxID=1353952 RepID=A0A165CMR7_9BASI|nr:hypothetical protein CALCODRAFT_153595 [Calocera cornea HHB12733]